MFAPHNLPPLPPSPQIDPTPVERVIELPARAAEHLRVAYHGVRSAIAGHRMERAGEVMERMDHKEALRREIGGLATRPQDRPDRVNSPHRDPQARTFGERVLSHRHDKRDFQVRLKQSERDHLLNLYGSNSSRNERANTLGTRSMLSKWARRGSVEIAKIKGELTPEQVRRQRRDINTQPTLSENPEQRRTRKVLEKSQKRLGRATAQPVLTNWRSFRQGRAVKRIMAKHGAAEEHSALALDKGPEMPHLLALRVGQKLVESAIERSAKLDHKNAFSVELGTIADTRNVTEALNLLNDMKTPALSRSEKRSWKRVRRQLRRTDRALVRRETVNKYYGPGDSTELRGGLGQSMRKRIGGTLAKSETNLDDAADKLLNQKSIDKLSSRSRKLMRYATRRSIKNWKQVRAIGQRRANRRKFKK